MEKAELQDRVGRLANFGGMDKERAEALLRLLPEMGRIRSERLLYLAGLKEMETASGKSLAKPNHHLALRVLADALPEAARSTDANLGILLRRLLEKRQGNTMQRCLIAMLRSYNDRLLHPACTAPSSAPYAADTDGDDDFGTLEAAEEEE